MANVQQGGGTATFDEFFYGIGQQESGGNYGSVNGGSGALGKYQIMPGNVPAWSQKYMGTTWTPQQFLGDPYKQEALAKAVLADYYQKWGPRGAASAWYSGNPALNLNYNSQNGGPSIGAYVDQVLGKAMGHPGTPGRAYGQAENIPVTTVDNRVKETKAPLALPGSAGVGAVSAAGVDAINAPGVGAVASDGSQAFTEQAPARTEPAQGTSIPAMPNGASTGPATGSRGQAVNAAMKWIGTPYVFGGGSPNGPTRSANAHGNFNDVGFDCSGLVQYALGAAGVHDSSHFSYDQLKLGQRTDVSKLQPGDLVGFGDGGHIALYAGDGKIIEAASTGTNVRERALGANEGAWGVSLSGLYK